MPLNLPTLPPAAWNALLRALPKKLSVTHVALLATVLALLYILQNGTIAYQGTVDFRYSGNAPHG